MRAAHKTYRHLSEKDRVIAGLTYSQLLQLLATGMLVTSLAVWLPWPGATVRLPLAIMFGGLPVAVSVGASGRQFSPSRTLRRAWRWRRRPKYYVPGGGEQQARYIILPAPPSDEPQPIISRRPPVVLTPQQDL
jgi:hypothetical protein